MDTERCKQVEQKNLGTEEEAERFDNCRVPTLDEIRAHYSLLKSGNHLPVSLKDAKDGNAGDTRNMPKSSNLREIINKKRKRELLEKFETIYQKVCHKLDNVFRGV